MAKFTVLVSFQATKYVTVEAQNEEEAQDKAVEWVYNSNWNNLENPEVEVFDCYGG